MSTEPVEGEALNSVGEVRESRDHTGVCHARGVNSVHAEQAASEHRTAKSIVQGGERRL